MQGSTRRASEDRGGLVGRRPFRALPLLGTLLLAAALPGCGGGEPSDRAAGLATRRLELRELQGRDAPEPERIHAFHPLSEKNRWTAGKASITQPQVKVSKDEGRPALMVQSEGQKVLVRKGAVDLTRVNQIDLHMIADRPVWVSLEFVSKGKPVARTLPVLRESEYYAFHVVQPLEWPLPGPVACDEIAIRFDGEAARCAVLSLQLYDRPSSSYAPADTGRDIDFTALSVTMPGRWLTTHRTLAAMAEIGPESELVFDYLQPKRTRRLGIDPVLVVTIEDEGGGQIVQRFELEGSAPEPSSWHDERISLAELRRGEATVEFRIEDAEDAACLVANLAVVEPCATVRPSIVLVTSDTHRADHVGAAALGVDVATPVLDRLAAEGVLFTDCFAAINSTCPSHAALMTGVHPRDVAIADNATPLNDTAPTLAEALRGLGYRTVAAVSIAHLSPQISGLHQGFDVYSSPPDGERVAADTVDAALELIESIEDEPVFLWVHLFDAHAPYAPPDEHDRRYYSGGDPFDPGLPDPGIAREKLAPELHGLRDLEFPRAQYRAEVSYLDEQLERLLFAERFRSSIRAFVADHGESLGEHGIWFDHSGLFPQSVHVPLLLAWPDAPRGARVDERVLHTDLGRTLLLLAGDPKSKFPGRDLSALAGPEPKRRDEPRFLLSGNFTSAAIDDGRHYLILVLRETLDPRLDAQSQSHRAFLYDRSTDPGCERDIADAEPATAKRLRNQLVDWLGRSRNLGWAGGRLHDPKILAQLAELGYVMESQVDTLWVADDCEWCQRYRSDE